MALIKCSECGKEISDKADVCMNCGNPIQKAIKQEKIKKRKSFDSLTKEEKRQLLDIMNSEGEYHNGFTIVMTLLGVLAFIGWVGFGFFGMFINNGNNNMLPLSIYCFIGTIIIFVCSNVYTTSKLRKYYKENADIEIMENDEENWKI